MDTGNTQAPAVEPTQAEKVFFHLKTAFELMADIEPSRELSVAKTQLETAIMWFNKDRTVKGEFEPTKTFVH